jgi:hypothetical protein
MEKILFSLGDHCAPADAIRDIFGVQSTSCFDWLITPTKALIDILDTNAEKFGLKISYAMNGASIFCENYGCYYHHEFEKNNNGICTITPESLSECRSKLIYKYNKMINLAKKYDPIFLRYIHPAARPSNDSDYIYDIATLNKIDLALSKSIGKSDYKLIFITIEENSNKLIQDNELFDNKFFIRSHTGGQNKEEQNKFWFETFKEFGVKNLTENEYK